MCTCVRVTAFLFSENHEVWFSPDAILGGIPADASPGEGQFVPPNSCPSFLIWKLNLRTNSVAFPKVGVRRGLRRHRLVLSASESVKSAANSAEDILAV